MSPTQVKDYENFFFSGCVCVWVCADGVCVGGVCICVCGCGCGCVCVCMCVSVEVLINWNR